MADAAADRLDHATHGARGEREGRRQHRVEACDEVEGLADAAADGLDHGSAGARGEREGRRQAGDQVGGMADAAADRLDHATHGARGEREGRRQHRVEACDEVEGLADAAVDGLDHGSAGARGEREGSRRECTERYKQGGRPRDTDPGDLHRVPEGVHERARRCDTTSYGHLLQARFFLPAFRALPSMRFSESPLRQTDSAAAEGREPLTGVVTLHGSGLRAPHNDRISYHRHCLPGPADEAAQGRSNRWQEISPARGGGQEPTWPQSPAKLRVLGLGGALSRHAHPREARRASTVTACAVASMRSILTSGTRNQPTAVKAAEISTRAV